MRILLIEDDTSMSKSMSITLRKEGHVVQETDLGEDGLEIGKLYEYDVIILDLMLPDIDGHEVLRRLRDSRIRTPILVISGLTGVDTKVKVLASGGDDYLTKPFDVRELTARVASLARRSRGHADNTIMIGELKIDMAEKRVYVRNQTFKVTAKEYMILELLSMRRGSTLSKDAFLNHLYNGVDDEPEAKIIDVFICKLRKKIAEATGTGNEAYIRTIWGRGYMLEAPDKNAPDKNMRADMVAAE
jgi:two-component system cell cycle response regulator CtrA